MPRMMQSILFPRRKPLQVTDQCFDVVSFILLLCSVFCVTLLNSLAWCRALLSSYVRRFLISQTRTAILTTVFQDYLSSLAAFRSFPRKSLEAAGEMFSPATKPMVSNTYILYSSVTVCYFVMMMPIINVKSSALLSVCY